MFRIVLASWLALCLAGPTLAQETIVSRSGGHTTIKIHDNSPEARERRSQIAQRTRARLQARREARERQQLSRQRQQTQYRQPAQYRYQETYRETRPAPPVRVSRQPRVVDPVWGPYSRPEPLWATPSFPPFGSPVVFGPGFANFGPAWGPGFGPGFVGPGPGFIGPGRCRPMRGRW